MYILPWGVYVCYGRLDENFGVKSEKIRGVKLEYEEILCKVMENQKCKMVYEICHGKMAKCRVTFAEK